MDYESDSSLSGSDRDLQEAFVEGKLKNGLNIPQEAPKKLVNNIEAMKHKLQEIKLTLPWIQRLDSINDQAALAPELAAELLQLEEKRHNELTNNKKLAQFKPSDDPVLNDFKRELMFQRQAQAAILDAIPKLKAMDLATKRPEDYFAEMAKSDEHMQKIREHLMQKQQHKLRSERVKQLRQQKKEGKMLQIQTKLQRQEEKKQMLDQVKKYRKGVSKDLDFLDNKSKAISRKSLEKRKMRDKKFGFGGKKKGSKLNTKDSAAEINEYRRPKKTAVGGKSRNKKPQRPGKNRRLKSKKNK